MADIFEFFRQIATNKNTTQSPISWIIVGLGNPGEEYRKALGYCGSHSGRDGAKLTQCGLSTCEVDGIPVIEQSHTVLLCKKLYAQFLQEDCFVETAPIPRYYPDKDYHCMYIAEVTDLYIKE